MTKIQLEQSREQCLCCMSKFCGNKILKSKKKVLKVQMDLCCELVINCENLPVKVARCWRKLNTLCLAEGINTLEILQSCPQPDGIFGAGAK